MSSIPSSLEDGTHIGGSRSSLYRSFSLTTLSVALLGARLLGQALSATVSSRQTLRDTATSLLEFATMDSRPEPDRAIGIGIVTVSDRASRGEYDDRSGPAIESYLSRVIRSKLDFDCRVVPDERPDIEEILIDLADSRHCALVLTTGGTGPAPRDVTPEAAVAVGERQLPGFGERMRHASWNHVPTAILSRQIAVIRGRCLILTLPGNPKAITECLDAVFATIPHCLELLGWPRLAVANRQPDPH